MTENQPSVLIIGAGPTGLMMACELARHDISFRIIDKKQEPTQGSNATWIQTRTLEIFDAIGIADRFIKKGHKCEAINFYLEGKCLATIPLSKIDSTYPFILMLPQHETEKLLITRLKESNIYVERSRELTNIQPTNNGAITTVQLPDGSIENITSNWVIACDGANSTVREKCKIPFPGKDSPEQFMVADARMSSLLPSNEIHVFFDKGVIFPDRSTIFSAFPWGSKEYRLSANLYQQQPSQNFYEHQVKEIVAERTYGNYIVESVSWISPFWIHGRMVNEMRIGSIFLAGDAAHIHSPAGGQGMNSGLQDAYNLVWKLALVLKGKATPLLLDSYQTERHPIVSEIVNQTEYLTDMALFDESFVTQLKEFGSKISSSERLSKKIGMDLTQLNMRYENSPIINYKENISSKSPKPGERAPDVIINPSKRLYNYLHNTLHNVLLFTDPSKQNKSTTITDIQQWISENFLEVIKTHIVAKDNNLNLDNIILDSEANIFKRYHINSPAIYIIRPDNYIAYCSEELDFNSLKDFLKKYLI